MNKHTAGSVHGLEAEAKLIRRPGIVTMNAEEARDGRQWILRWRLEADVGHTRLRLDIPLRDVHSGPATVELVLRNGEEKIADASLPLMVFDQLRLEGDAAALDGMVTSVNATTRPTGVATAQFYLERVQRFATKAAPAESTGAVQANWEELQCALSDLRAGLPVFGWRRDVVRQRKLASLTACRYASDAELPDVRGRKGNMMERIRPLCWVLGLP